MPLARRGLLLPLGFAALAPGRPARADAPAALEGAEVFDGERRIGRVTILVAKGAIQAIGFPKVGAGSRWERRSWLSESKRAPG